MSSGGGTTSGGSGIGRGGVNGSGSGRDVWDRIDTKASEERVTGRAAKLFMAPRLKTFRLAAPGRRGGLGSRSMGSGTGALGRVEGSLAVTFTSVCSLAHPSGGFTTGHKLPP